MKLSIKAPLYSALLFPGSGYFLLQKPKRGVISIAMVCAALLTILQELYSKAVIISEQIKSGNIPFDITIIHQKVTEAIHTLPMTMFVILSIIIGGIWAFSIVDCYLLGKKHDQYISTAQP